MPAREIVVVRSEGLPQTYSVDTYGGWRVTDHGELHVIRAQHATVKSTIATYAPGCWSEVWYR